MLWVLPLEVTQRLPTKLATWMTTTIRFRQARLVESNTMQLASRYRRLLQPPSNPHLTEILPSLQSIRQCLSSRAMALRVMDYPRTTGINRDPFTTATMTAADQAVTYHSSILDQTLHHPDPDTTINSTVVRDHRTRT